MVELTERLLMDAGGWQAMKLARALLDSGRVVSAAYDPPVLRGLVREGDQELRAGLKIVSKSNIENLCTCRTSRQWGTICAHSLAVGLARLRPASAGLSPAPAISPAVPAAVPLPAAPPKGRQFTTEAVPGAVPVELSVVLPPLFPSAWERGNLTVGIEVVRSGRRIMLQALEASGTFRCSEADLRVVNTLRTLGDGGLSGMLSLSRDTMLQLLETLKGHPRVYLGKVSAAYVSMNALRPVLNVVPNGQGGLALRVDWPPGARLLLAGSRAWSLKDAEFAQAVPGLPSPYLELLRREIAIPAAQAGTFLATELPLLRAHFQVAGVAGGEAPSLVPEPGQFSLTLEGSLNHLTARLQRIYSKRVVTIGITGPGENWALPDPSDPARLFCRDLDGERFALEELTAAGFTGPDTTGHFILRGERPILAFFAAGYPQLQRRWEVTLGPRFTHVTADVERVAPRVEIISSGEQWFEMQFDLGTDGGDRFSASEIQRLLQLGQNHVRLKSGKVAVFDKALLDDFQSVLRDCNPDQRRPGAYRMAKAQAGYLEAAAREAGFAIQAPPAWRAWAQAQQGQTAPEPIDFGDLDSVLRSYQKHGITWLTFLNANRLGGILADDMGLGKTLQALAFLRSQPGPALIVCPSSLIYNWRREVEKFTPERKVLVLEGPGRAALFASIPEVDLVITSYPLLRRDASRYRSIPFTTAILDEAQHIKNPDSQNAQAAQVLRADRKFILTGTPVENSVRDVWSLMNFVMPGYLGDREDFRERYELPISRNNSAEALARLSKRLRPFLLRRRKREVATDLPEKLEQVAYCELATKQRQVYSALLEGARNKIDRAVDGKNSGQSRMVMLTALLRLRQAACDLRLLNKGEAGAPELENGTRGMKALDPADQEEARDSEGSSAAGQSGKLELFAELLQEALDGGHRVLVFSQFVSMLSLIRRELDASGIEFCYLDGQTKDRAGVVDRFQTGAVPVFLISLKAGGVGLNLTAADTVIHFDPWWNPAVEAQATDRAHRIGQKNPVTAYKLIARGTVEEKILNLQRKKREMIDATIENEEPMMEGLTMEDIRSLLME